MARVRVNRRKDHRIFTKTARKVNVKNIPGRLIQRGGTRL